MRKQTQSDINFSIPNTKTLLHSSNTALEAMSQKIKQSFYNNFKTRDKLILLWIKIVNAIKVYQELKGLLSSEKENKL